MARSRGFTIVELLVVVAIIALLIAILLPSLSRAKEMAIRARDLSNHRHIVLAAASYAGEHSGLYPLTDGSWLQRHKSGQRIQGIGLLLVGGYLPLTPEGVEAAMFCPGANPTWNWQQPGHAYREFTREPLSNNQAHGTYVGKFCTFIGYSDRAKMYAPGMGQPGADELSPFLSACYVFDSSEPWNDDRQGHAGEGVAVGHYDGSAMWVDFGDVYSTGKPWPGYGPYGNNNPYGNFWHWAKAEYGAGW